MQPYCMMLAKVVVAAPSKVGKKIMATPPDWPSVLAACSPASLASALGELPASTQLQLAQRLSSENPPEPWSVAAGSVSDLLHEAELAPLYAATFAEYGYERVEQLIALGREGFLAECADLGVTLDHRLKLESAAFSARPCGSSGGALSSSFLSALRPAWSAHMGVENMGLLLYALCRFVKPSTALEIGAGYTSLWLLQAMKDNHAELDRCARAARSDRVGSSDDVGYTVAGAEWMRADVLASPRATKPPILHTCDMNGGERDAAGRPVYASRVSRAAESLGLAHHLRLHIADAYELAGSEAAEGESLRELDLLWLDFGAGLSGRLDDFLDAWWPRLTPGGYLLVHSTLTNAVTRRWTDGMRARVAPHDAPAAASRAEGEGAAQEAQPPPARDAMGRGFATLSFLEPHKMYQNSVSIFQKRPDGWGEEVLTTYP